MLWLNPHDLIRMMVGRVLYCIFIFTVIFAVRSAFDTVDWEQWRAACVGALLCTFTNILYVHGRLREATECQN